MLRAIGFLATRVTKWTDEDGRDLYRLMCYIHTTLDYRMYGWVSQDPARIQSLDIKLYTDADFAGDRAEYKSTSGIFVRLESEGTNCSMSEKYKQCCIKMDVKKR